MVDYTWPSDSSFNGGEDEPGDVTVDLSGDGLEPFRGWDEDDE